MPTPIQFIKNHWDFIPLGISVAFFYSYGATRFYNRMHDDPEKRIGNVGEQLKIPDYMERVSDKTVFSEEFQNNALKKY